jgi:hypothetical protein
MTSALTFAHRADLLATSARDSGSSAPDDRWAARVLEILRRLRAERALKLDNVLISVDSCFTYLLSCAPAHLPTTAALLTVNRSHAITVEVERLTRRCDGVLISCGSHGGGYVLRVQGGRLRYEYLCAGAMYTVTSDREVPLGPSTLRFVFTKTGHLRGIGALYIDNQQVGLGHISNTLPYLISSEGPDERPVGTEPMDRHGRGGNRPFDTIKLVMISCADNPEPLPPAGSVVIGIE